MASPFDSADLKIGSGIHHLPVSTFILLRPTSPPMQLVPQSRNPGPPWVQQIHVVLPMGHWVWLYAAHPRLSSSPSPRWLWIRQAPSPEPQTACTLSCPDLGSLPILQPSATSPFLPPPASYTAQCPGSRRTRIRTRGDAETGADRIFPRMCLYSNRLLATFVSTFSVSE